MNSLKLSLSKTVEVCENILWMLLDMFVILTAAFPGFTDQMSKFSLFMCIFPVCYSGNKTLFCVTHEDSKLPFWISLGLLLFQYTKAPQLLESVIETTYGC